MAITRTQIAKQLLAKGGTAGSNGGSMLVTPTRDGSRPGYYGPDAGFGDVESRAKRGPRDDPDRFGPSNKPPTGKGEDKPVRRRIQDERQKDFIENPEKYRNFGKGEEGIFKKGLDLFKQSRYNLIPNNPQNEFRFIQNLKYNNPTVYGRLPQNLKDLYEQTEEDFGDTDTRSYKNFPKFSFEDFEDLKNFETGLDEPGLENFAEYAAKYAGAPGLKFSGNVGDLDKYVDTRNPDGSPLTYGYTKRDDYGEGRNATSDYERRLRELEQSIAANPITSPVEEDEIINYRLMADGGRIGFFTGMREQEQRAKRGPRDDPDRFGPSNKAPTGKGEDGPQKPSTNVGGGGGGITELTSKKNIPTPNIDISKFNIEDLINFGLVDEEQDTMKVAEAINFNKLGIAKDPFTPKSTMTTGSVVDNFMKENPNATKGDFVNALESGSLGVSGRQLFEKNVGDLFEGVNLGKSMSPFDVTPTFQGTTDKTFKGNIDIDKGALEQDALDALPSGFFIGANDGRAVLAEGGMPYEGGIMDLESARQMYSLGKLVKKITRGVKKIAKSPIGKAALAFGAYKLGGGFLKDKGGIPGIFDLIKANPYKSIFGLSALSGLMTKEEDEEPLYAGADIADPNYIMDNPQLFLNRRLSASGGLMRTGYQEGSKEPVAKKVMPLLDMDGQEKDYRETGGFVDMGRMEKADDVPARLSKNEFVFTADAVRNAGEGNVDKGAEVMYNMMKNLESGGEVSEESQGLEGAREMFQTSQRLEEVL